MHLFLKTLFPLCSITTCITMPSAAFAERVEIEFEQSFPVPAQQRGECICTLNAGARLLSYYQAQNNPQSELWEDTDPLSDYKALLKECPKSLDPNAPSNLTWLLNRVNTKLAEEQSNVPRVPQRLIQRASSLVSCVQACCNVINRCCGSRLGLPLVGPGPEELALFLNQSLTSEQKAQGRHYVVQKQAEFQDIENHLRARRPVLVFVINGRYEIRPRYDNFVWAGSWFWPALNQICPSVSPNPHAFLLVGVDTDKKEVKMLDTNSTTGWISYTQFLSVWQWDRAKQDVYIRAILDAFGLIPNTLLVESEE